MSIVSTNRQSCEVWPNNVNKSFNTKNQKIGEPWCDKQQRAKKFGHTAVWQSQVWTLFSLKLKNTIYANANILSMIRKYIILFLLGIYKKKTDFALFCYNVSSRILFFSFFSFSVPYFSASFAWSRIIF